jgi:hypothetical protein
MKRNDQIRELVGEIEKTKTITSQNFSFYRKFIKNDLPRWGKTTASAMVLSQIFVDYYTSIETLFLRISHFFENNLQKDEWHKSLLHKMTLSITEIRKPVISDTTFTALTELLRFRHFRRYYFELQYDWDRIILVEKKYKQTNTLLKKDLDAFIQFLQKLC